MSDQRGSYGEDEPIIGLTYAPPPASPPPAEPAYDYRDDEELPADDWQDDQYVDSGQETYAYDDDGYYVIGDDAEQPARQPLFYVFIVLALVIGAGVVFGLFALVRSGDDDAGPAATQHTRFRVQIVSPAPGERLPAGQVHEVIAQATSTDRITKFALLVDGRVVDEVDAVPPQSGAVYTATLRTRFDQRGEYTLRVRVTAASGDSEETPGVRVSAFEDAGDRPASIRGRVTSTTPVYAGPSETADEVGRLRAGTEVDIRARTRDSRWLQVDGTTPGWVPRDTIQELDSLALVQVREPTPTPQPTQRPATPTATPTTSPTPNPAELPDFVPADARLVFGEGGKTLLRVTIRNGGAPYQGVLEVAVSGGVVDSLAFPVNLTTNGTTVFDFDAPAVTEPIDVTVSIDPSNAVVEVRDDNNTTTFRGLRPPAPLPNVTITGVSVGNDTVQVTVANSGGAIAQGTPITVTLQGNSSTLTGGLGQGQSLTFVVPRPPGNGTARVTVSVNGVVVASADVGLGDNGPAPTPTQGATPTPTEAQGQSGG
jgi:hypothetical protein